MDGDPGPGDHGADDPAVLDDGAVWARSLRFAPMTLDAAHEIADHWHYPAPWDFYDIAADADDLEEFLTPGQWPAVHQQVCRGDELVAFFSAVPDAGSRSCEIALGVRPDLTGQGRGEAFLRAALDRLRSDHPDAAPPGTRITLAVAAFNQRAIRVYERVGFVEARRFDQHTNGGVHPFVAMELR